MVEPPELDNGIERFRLRLHGAAHAFLTINHPDFVAACDAIESDEAFDAALEPDYVPRPVKESFKRFRELFTLLADLDYMVAHVRPLYRLLSKVPDQATLAALNIRPHEWEMIVVQSTLFTLSGLYERAIKLIPPAVRNLNREYDPRLWKPKTGDLIDDLRKYQARAKVLRDGLAHGGEPVSALNQPGRWEVGIVLALPINVAMYLDRRDEESIAERFATLRDSLTEAVAVISSALDILISRIDWGRSVGPM